MVELNERVSSWYDRLAKSNERARCVNERLAGVYERKPRFYDHLADEKGGSDKICELPFFLRSPSISIYSE